MKLRVYYVYQKYCAQFCFPQTPTSKFILNCNDAYFVKKNYCQPYIFVLLAPCISQDLYLAYTYAQ
jgi:hypothetical protein